MSLGAEEKEVGGVTSEKSDAGKKTLWIILGVIGAVVVVALVALLLLLPRGTQPTAAIEASPASGVTIDTVVTFAAKANPGTIHAKRTVYEWYVGDQKIGGQAILSYTFPQAGTYTVELHYDVIDSGNRHHDVTDEYVVSVENPPIGAVVPSFTPDLGWADQSVTFDASASQLFPSPSPSLKLVWIYQWDFSDGTSGASGRTMPHRFPGASTYTVRLTVTVNDQFGRTQSKETAKSIRIMEPRPVDIVVSGTGLGGTVLVNGPVTIRAVVPPDLAGSTYQWDMTGNGAFASTPTPSYTYVSGYGSPGVHTGRLMISNPSISPIVRDLAVTVGGGQDGQGLALSGGLFALGDLRLWDASVGWSLEDLGLDQFTLLVGYGANTNTVEFDRTAQFPEIAQAGYRVTTTVSDASILTLTGHYALNAPITLAGTIGYLTLEGVHSASCRVTIAGQAPPVPYKEGHVVVGMGIGLRVGFGLITLQVLFSL